MLSPTSLWNQAMIERYDLVGPRYTSYPTAPHFAEDFPASEVQAAIARSNAGGRPLSLYFHIPFCDTICFYCGCNKIVTANKGRAEPYIDLLHRELTLRARQFDSARPVRQLHWGGGTPTFLSAAQMRTLMRLTDESFPLLRDDSGDYSIEVHPGRMDTDTLGVLREIGFNRLSMGVQDFDPRVQRAVNRFNSPEQLSELCLRARREGFHSLSMDLIYGLPHQSLDSMAATLEQVIALGPDRLSLFNYAHMPHLFKSQRHIDAGALPSPSEKLAIVHHAIDRLQAAGYRHIGMDHFARPGDGLALAQSRGEMQRNFQGYTTHGDCDLLAFGLSAISAIDNVYLQNHKDMVRYAQSLAVDGEPAYKGLALSADDLLRRAVIGQLICHFSLDYTVFERDFGIDFKRYFAAALESLQPLARDGLLNLDDGGIAVSASGRLLIRRICMAFDAYLDTPEPVRYSRIL